MKKSLLFLVFLALIPGFIGAMDLELLTTKGNYNISQDIFSRVPADGTLKTLKFASPFFGKETVERLVKIKKNNPHATIDVLCGPSSKKHIDPLAKAGINVTVKKSLHAKAIAWKKQESYPPVEDEYSDYEETAQDYTVTETFAANGSYNFGGTSKFNNESMLISTNPRVYKQTKKIFKQFMHASTPKKSDKIVIEETPLKYQQYSSFNVHFTDSRLERIKTLSDTNDPTDKLIITTMTFNDETLIETLQQVIEKRTNALDCEIFFNKDALNHPELLKKLVQLKGVTVYIRNEEPIYPTSPIQKIQHTKFLLRMAAGKWFMLTSSANWTDEGNTQRNSESYIPEPDQALIDKAIDYINTDIKPVCEAITADTIDQKINDFDAKKQARKKRKAEDNETGTSSDNSPKKPAHKKSKKQLSFAD